jgi:hypothetical protein
MSTLPSLRPMFVFSGWVIDIDWNDSSATVYLRRDGRIQQLKCCQCHNSTGKMRETERTVLDLPLGILSVQLYQSHPLNKNCAAILSDWICVGIPRNSLGG